MKFFQVNFVLMIIINLVLSRVYKEVNIRQGCNREHCEILGNCCTSQNYKMTDREIELRNKIPKSILEEDVTHRWDCLAIADFNDFLREEKRINQYAYRTINWCPSETPQDLKMLCERPEYFNKTGPILDIPALSNDSRVLYGNIFCGHCHNETNFMKWKGYVILNAAEAMPIILDPNEKTIQHWFQGKLIKVSIKNFFLPFGNYTAFMRWESINDFVNIGLDTSIFNSWHKCHDVDIETKCTNIPGEVNHMFKDFCQNMYYVNHNNIVLSSKDQFCRNEQWVVSNCYNIQDGNRYYSYHGVRVSNRIFPILGLWNQYYNSKEIPFEYISYNKILNL